MLNYVLTDLQGSVRAVMNNNGVGTSTVIARHDYLPFGEEISSGVGMRTMAQGYNVPDSNRQKYAMLERDSTGLDHTWWRKYESTAGRWTSPDPMHGHLGDPQSFNAYVYAANDPANLADPSGLMGRIWWDFGWGSVDASKGWGDVSAGFWGWGDLNNRPRHTGRDTIAAAEKAYNDRAFRYLPIDEATVLGLEFGRTDPFLGYHGELSQRDSWYGYNNRNFQRWFHRCWKQPGDPDASKKEIEDAYSEWLSRGAPTGGNCWGGKDKQKQSIPQRVPVPAPQPPSKEASKAVVVAAIVIIVIIIIFGPKPIPVIP